MAKKKSSPAKKTSKADQNLMLLAGAAALIVGLFAIFAYRSQPAMLLETPAPTPQVLRVTMQSPTDAVSATASFQEINGKVIVNINTDTPLENPVTAFIRAGTCASKGVIKYSLKPVAGNTSSTVIDTNLTSLKSMLPLSISEGQACGELSI